MSYFLKYIYLLLTKKRIKTAVNPNLLFYKNSKQFINILKSLSSKKTHAASAKGVIYCDES